jgi:beta-lactamase superfamily II metal-dependent hydrolase
VIRIEMLPALYGDCIWLSYGKSEKSLRHVLIDTGFEACSKLLRQRMLDDEKLALELFVMTHIDADHIEGSVFLLQDEQVAKPKRIKEVWFNGWKHIEGFQKDALGAKQGEYFSALIQARKLKWNKAFSGKAVVVPEKGKLPVKKLAGGMKLTLLSPTPDRLAKLRRYWTKDLKKVLKPGDEKKAMALLDKDKKFALDALGASTNVEKLVTKKFSEDKAQANGSSIAFLLEYEGRRLLFTGDAHPSVLVGTIDRLLGKNALRGTRRGKKSLPLDVFKLAHHGSRANLSSELVSRLTCDHVLVSSNGKKFNHPDPEAIARVIDGFPKVTVHFNYGSKFTKPWLSAVPKKKYGYKTAVGKAGSLVLELP